MVRGDSYWTGHPKTMQCYRRL